MKRRIVHAIESLGIGGAQAMLFELYFAIDKYFPEYSQSVILTNDKKIDRKYVNSYGLPFEVVSTKRHFTQKIIDYTEPVIIIYHKLMCSNLESLRGIYKKAPIIVVSHTFSQNLMHNRIRHCDGVVSVCNFMRDELHNKFHVRGNHEVIHNSVNGFKYEHIAPIERDRENLLITGRINCLNAIKYSDSWVEWVSSVKLPFTLVHDYIGGGATKRAKSVVADTINKRNEINILGPIQNVDDKISRLKSWDLFLYEINRDEGVSVAVLESLACGVPVICSNHYGNKEIIEDGVNGYVFNTRKEAREIILELGNDKKKLNSLKKTTLEHFLDKLDARVAAEKYINFIEKTVIHRASKKRGVTTVVGKASNKNKKKMKTRKVLSSKPRKRIKSTIGKVRKKDKDKTKNKKPNKKPNKKTNKKPNFIFLDNLEKNNTGDKFSILTSAYNASLYIDDWANSILKQAYRPLEVIVTNDASTDKTKKKLNEYIDIFNEKDISTKIINNKQRYGCGSSYRIALQHSTANFQGILDADDMLVPSAVSFIMDVFYTFNDFGWIYSQYDNYSDKKKKTIGRGFSAAPNPGYSLLEMGKLNKHTYSHWRTFSSGRIKKIHKIFKQGLKSGVDKYMGYRLEEMSKGLFVDRVLYRYRKDVPGCISKTEPARKTWNKIMKEAQKRRKKYGLEPYPVFVLKM